MTSARSVAVAVLVSLPIGVGACDQPRSPAPVSPPAELARFYNQKLTFGPCANYATTGADEKLFASDPRFECARLRVPLNYADPDGGTAQVAMLRVPARGKSIGPLLVNSGGPGGTGMNFAAGLASHLAKPITDRFDLIGFDPRGVGATTPAVDCFTDEELRAGSGQTEFLISAGTLTEKGAEQLVDKCAKRSGGKRALTAIATRDTVRDMDVLRAALGQEKFSFLGQSYGTRVGAFYAAEYPHRVRAMVLDGAVDPRLSLVDRRISQYAGFQRSFEQMAADCATRPGCPLGTDPDRATRAFQDIVRPLLDRPLPSSSGPALTYNDAIGFVISGLYTSKAWPMITRGLAELRDGRPQTLIKLGQLLSGPDDGGRLGNFSEAAYAIVCMDEQRLTAAQAVEFRGRLYKVAPFTDPGRGREGARDSCEAWPAPPKPTYPFPDRVDGLPPTLVVSITGDPSTPYDAGIRLAEALGSSLVTVEGEQHTIVAAGKNKCVADLTADYLVALRTPPVDARCTL